MRCLAWFTARIRLVSAASACCASFSAWFRRFWVASRVAVAVAEVISAVSKSRWETKPPSSSRRIRSFSRAVWRWVDCQPVTSAVMAAVAAYLASSVARVSTTADWAACSATRADSSAARASSTWAAVVSRVSWVSERVACWLAAATATAARAWSRLAA
jgi:hypothetical protein